MSWFFDTLQYNAANVQEQTWAWFNGLNREEWLVLLAVTFACGFVALLGFQTRRL